MAACLRYSGNIIRYGIVMRPLSTLLLLYLTLFCTLVSADQETASNAPLPAGFSSAMVTIGTPGTPLHVLQGGRSGAPWLLLIHGLGQGTADWYPLLPELARHYQVLAFDLPGFGQSPTGPGEVSLQQYATLVHELVHQHAGAPLRVMGHSMGAAVALRYAHDYPADVDRLLLLDAAGILHPSVFLRHLSQVRTKPVPIPLLGGLIESGERLANGISSSIQDRLAARGSGAADSARHYVAGKASAGAALALGRENFNPLLGQLEVPVWMLWGADDPVAPPRTGRALHSLLPRSSLELLPGIGHVPMSEATAATLAWILPALTQQLTPAPAPPQAKYASASCLRDKTPRTFSNGSWSQLVIDRCRQVSISNARIGQLRINDSNVELDNVTLDAPDVALVANDSNIVATGLRLRGPAAFKVRASRIDLAAAVVDSASIGELDGKSRLFLSLSQWCDGQQRHGLHGVWEPARQTVEQAFPANAMGQCSLSEP